MAMDKPAPASPTEAAKPPVLSEPALPLLVVRRDEARPPVSRVAALWRLLRPLRFVPLVMATVMLGGIIGLYFQPPGMRRAQGRHPRADRDTAAG